MTTTQTSTNLKTPLDLTSKEFANNKYEYYKWLRTEAPVAHCDYITGKAYVVSRYEDCVALLKDPRVIRDNRTIDTSTPLLPTFIPLPKSSELLLHSMIGSDEPDHKRLRSLVHQAFTRKSMAELSDRIDQLTNNLLDEAEAKSKADGSIDLKAAYALPIPVTVIQEMVGVPEEDMSRFHEGIETIINGFSGVRVILTMLWDLPRLSNFVRGWRPRGNDEFVRVIVKPSDRPNALLSELHVQTNSQGVWQLSDTVGESLSENRTRNFLYPLLIGASFAKCD